MWSKRRFATIQNLKTINGERNAAMVASLYFAKNRLRPTKGVPEVP